MNKYIHQLQTLKIFPNPVAAHHSHCVTQVCIFRSPYGSLLYSMYSHLSADVPLQHLRSLEEWRTAAHWKSMGSHSAMPGAPEPILVPPNTAHRFLYCRTPLSHSNPSPFLPASLFTPSPHVLRTHLLLSSSLCLFFVPPPFNSVGLYLLSYLLEVLTQVLHRLYSLSNMGLSLSPSL